MCLLVVVVVVVVVQCQVHNAKCSSRRWQQPQQSQESLALDTGLWALGIALWALGYGLWALGIGHWSPVTGHWSFLSLGPRLLDAS